MEVGEQLTKFKRERIEEVYEKEPNLPLWAYMERFDVTKTTLRKIFKVVDKRLGRKPKRRKRD